MMIQYIDLLILGRALSQLSYTPPSPHSKRLHMVKIMKKEEAFFQKYSIFLTVLDLVMEKKIENGTTNTTFFYFY